MTPEHEVNALCKELGIEAEIWGTQDRGEVLHNIATILAHILRAEKDRRQNMTVTELFQRYRELDEWRRVGEGEGHRKTF